MLFRSIDGLRDSLNHLCSGECEQDTPHNKHSAKSFAPTCTADGNYHYDCKECGSEKNVVRPYLGHNWVTSSSPPALCETSGYYSIKCTRCGSGSYKTLAPRYSSHTWEWWNGDQHRCINKNYVVAKYEYKIATVYGDVILVEVTVWRVCGTLRNHSLSAKSGCNYQSCSTCRGSKGSTSHNYSWVYGTKSRQYKCSVCGKVSKTEKLPAMLEY